jgi:hypothetical protein
MYRSQLRKAVSAVIFSPSPRNSRRSGIGIASGCLPEYEPAVTVPVPPERASTSATFASIHACFISSVSSLESSAGKEYSGAGDSWLMKYCTNGPGIRDPVSSTPFVA